MEAGMPGMASAAKAHDSQYAERPSQDPELARAVFALQRLRGYCDGVASELTAVYDALGERLAPVLHDDEPRPSLETIVPEQPPFQFGATTRYGASIEAEIVSAASELDRAVRTLTNINRMRERLAI